MTAPLLTVRTEVDGSDQFQTGSLVPRRRVEVDAGTEVEVWPAGDRTPTRDFHATYDSVARILYEVIPNDVKTGLLDEAAMKVTRLLHGQGDETDE